MFVLIFLISNLIFSENKKLNENYGIEDGEVYYINRKIEGADAKTFEVFEDGEYAKDKNNVYYEENVLNEADPKSFKSLSKVSSGLGKDKNKVYLFGLELKDVKPEKFQVVKEPITEKIIYVRDENNLFVIFYDYFSGFNFVKTKKIENIDFKTLKWKSAREMEDKNGKYIVNGSVIDEDKIEIKFIKK